MAIAQPTGYDTESTVADLIERRFQCMSMAALRRELGEHEDAERYDAWAMAWHREVERVMSGQPCQAFTSPIRHMELRPPSYLMA